MATFSNNAEVALGELAVSKATDSSVRYFGSLMVSEHTHAQDELNMIATQLNYILPSGLDEEHQNIRQLLSMMPGAAFDSAYIHTQVSDHQKAVTLFENEMANGRHQRVKDYADKYLPHINMHLQMADSIANGF